MKCGARHTVFLTSSGRVFSLGEGRFGQLGNGLFESSRVPVDTGLRDINYIDCGWNHCAAVNCF